MPHVIDEQLLQRFDVPGPRYTSYPTADRFVEAFGPADYLHALHERARGVAVRDCNAALGLWSQPGVESIMLADNKMSGPAQKGIQDCKTRLAQGTVNASSPGAPSLNSGRADRPQSALPRHCPPHAPPCRSRC